MRRDLATPKFQWDHPMLPNGAQAPFSCSQIEKSVTTSSDPYQVLLSSASAPAMFPRQDSSVSACCVEAAPLASTVGSININRKTGIRVLQDSDAV